MHFRKNWWVFGSNTTVRQQLLKIGYLPRKLIQDIIYTVRNTSYVSRNKPIGYPNLQAAYGATSVNRRRWRLPRKRAYSLFLSGFILLISTTCCFSFKIYQENILRANNDKIIVAKTSVNTALASLDAFLDLLAKRIKKHPDDDQKIVEILGADYTNLFEGSFPSIVALGYIPLSKDTMYSRLGVVKQSKNAKDFLNVENPQEHIHVIEKQLDSLGRLKAHISLKHLLSSNFMLADPKTMIAESNSFSAIINGKIVTFQLNSPQPSLFHFLKKYSRNIILLIIAAIGFTVLGGGCVYYLIRRHNKALRMQKDHLIKDKRDLQGLCAEKQELLCMKDMSLASQQKNSKKREELLLITINRLQTLASEGLSINSLALKLIAQDFCDPKTVLEIARMVNEANLTFKQISSGLPIMKDEATVDLKKVLQNTLGAFEEKIVTKGIAVNIQDSLQDSVQLDLVMLQIILYGAIKSILEHYLSQLDIHISPAAESGILISFTDDGHVPGPCKISAAQKNILSLSRQEMLEITQFLGWKINWGEIDGKNTMTLWLPNMTQVKGKVLSLAEFRKHG